MSPRQHRRRRLQRNDTLSRILTGALGAFMVAVSAFGVTHFHPPQYADPGGVNAIYLSLILFAVIGMSMIGYALRRRDPYVWF